MDLKAIVKLPTVLTVCLFPALLRTSVQAQTVSGSIVDENDLPLVGASVNVKGSTIGTVTDEEGKFTFEDRVVEQDDTLLINFLGYYPVVAPLGVKDRLKIVLESRPFNASEVVVSASRYDETRLEAPASIEKISAFEIQSAPSGDAYKSLNNLKDVHVVGNSLTFNVFNARGFNTSSPFRVVHFIDGMDTYVPALNFGPANLFGIPEVDLQNMEVITGPSSALYGTNALQGVLTATSKDPFIHQGVTAQIKGGSRSLVDAQLRVAKAFGKKERFAFKLTGSYMQAKDWIADDPQANGYLPTFTPPQDLNSQVAALDNTGDQNYGDFNNYAAMNPEVLPNQTPPGTQFRLPAYNEADLWDGNVYTARAALSLQYKITDRTRIEAFSKFAQGTAMYQGNNRALVKDYIVHQHKIEVRDDRFLVRAYATFEDAGNSYDLVLTGINAGFAGLGSARGNYLSAYVGAIDSLSNGFTNQITTAQVQQAISEAESAAANGYLQPGTEAFENVFQSVIENPNRPAGGKFTGRSNVQHVDAQYNLKFDFLTANVGGSWRRIDPRTEGYIYADTLDVNGNFTDISFMEYGGFLQVMAPFFKDKLKLHGSLRVDKSQNFNVQLSPRGAVTFKHKGHYFRVGYQAAFRNPTLNDQYFLLNTGPLIVRGNISGYDNLYTSQSVDQYLATPPPNRDPNTLQPLSLESVQPERLNTVEFGYKYLYKDKLLLDAGFYYNIYSNFIGSVLAVEPSNGLSTDSTGVMDIDTRQFTTYSIASNAQEDVSTLGASLSLKYSIMKGLMANMNYTFAHIFDESVSDNLIPGWNTPPHMFNIGLTGRRLYKGLGFSANFSWVDGYEWESPFSNRAARFVGLTETNVPSYHTLDLQVMYEVEKIYSTFRVGASNIYDNRHIEIWGGPEIGALVYGSWTFDLKFN